VGLLAEAVTGGSSSSSFVAAFGAVAVVLTTLIGFVTAVTGLVKLVRRPHDEAAAVDHAAADADHEARAWAETLEQLDAAGERAVAAEAESRFWRDKYVAVLEGRHTDPDPPPPRRPRR
jgi:Na+-transporting methylmalonyl-CoA/oxaloacetate decarboxylase gamma subunit